MSRKTSKKRLEEIQSLDVTDLKNDVKKSEKTLKENSRKTHKKFEKKLRKSKKLITKKIKNGKLINIEGFKKENILELILREAKSIGIRDGGAEVIAEKTASEVYDWAKKRSEITDDDLNNQLAKELKKYNADLAYLFEEKGKIL